MVRDSFYSIAFIDSTLTVHSEKDNVINSISYTPPEATYPSWFSITNVGSYSVDMDLFFAHYLDAMCLDTLDCLNFSVRCEVTNESNYLYPEGYVYYDSNSVYRVCNKVAPPLQGSLPSLNGNGSEFLDGDRVTVQFRDTVYTVDRSFFVLYSDNTYTTYYDLIGDNTSKLTCPQSLLTAVPLVIAP